MKLCMDGNNLIWFLNKCYIRSLDFTDKDCVEKYLKQLVSKFKNLYKIDFEGYYNVTLFVDYNYGVIIEAVHEELEYLDYFSNQIELNTKVVEGSFLYEISDIYDFMNDNFIIYGINDRFFVQINCEISDTKMGLLLEECDRIVYGPETMEIIKKAKVVR